MLCGLGMNAVVTDANAGSMPVVGMPSSLHPVSPMWHAATAQTRLQWLADQAQLGLFSIGDITLLFGAALIVGMCLRRSLKLCTAKVTEGGPDGRLELPNPGRTTSKRALAGRPATCSYIR
jgi:hypothetical protein